MTPSMSALVAIGPMSALLALRGLVRIREWRLRRRNRRWVRTLPPIRRTVPNKDLKAA